MLNDKFLTLSVLQSPWFIVKNVLEGFQTFLDDPTWLVEKNNFRHDSWYDGSAGLVDTNLLKITARTILLSET